eukprot:1144478-Pelagomonas_calceolata.AAC.1
MARLVEHLEVACTVHFVVAVRLLAGHRVPMDMVILDVQFMKLPGWSCAASYFIVMSHTADYSM